MSYVNVERVLVVDDYVTMGHRVVVVGRPHPGARPAHLKGDGTWQDIEESVSVPDDIGFRFPEGVLDAIVQEHLGVAAPQPATERHLTDAIAVRDRLLCLIEEGTGQNQRRSS